MPRLLQALKSLVTGRLAVARVMVSEEAPPSSAFSAAIAVLKELASSLQAYAPFASQYLGDKSQSERIFLFSVLLTVLLIVVVVPAYEALLGSGDEEKDGGLLSAVPAPRASMRMYKPDVSAICVNSDVMAHPPLSRASSSGSSCGSCSMETIEESEEENTEDDDPKPRVREGKKEVRIVSENSVEARPTFFAEEPSTRVNETTKKVFCQPDLHRPQ